MSPKPVVVLLGSKADLDHAKQITASLDTFGIASEIRIGSAHKVTEYVLAMLQAYEAEPEPRIFVTVAGRSNALSGVVDANVRGPVIACPPYSDKFGGMDLLSTVRMPSGVSPMLVLEPDAVGLAIAKMLAPSNASMAAKVGSYQSAQRDKVIADDRALRG